MFRNFINVHFSLSVTHLKNNYKSYSVKTRPNLFDLLCTMPRDPKHVLEAQRARQKNREKGARYVSGRVSLQVLGTGAEGAPRSLYVFSDQSRYLFNCGEGTQRLAHEHKMKLAKLEHIFITQSVWKNMGGLPGTALTIQDVGVPQITLHGPPGLDDLFVATKRFVVMKNLCVKMAECSEKDKFEDNVITVDYVRLEKTIQQEVCDFNDSPESLGDLDSNNTDKDTQAGCSILSDASTSTRSSRKRNRSRRNSQSLGRFNSSDNMDDDDTDYYAHEPSGQRSVSQKIPESSQLRLSKTKEKGCVMSYVCRLQPRPGALNLDKCVKYGVPAGPLLGKLKNGENVTLDSGVVVQPKDVLEPDDPGPIFVIVDCPTEDYLDSLSQHHKFKRHQKFADNPNDGAHLVVHFTPSSIVEHPKYAKWMKDFPVSTYHLMLNDKNGCMGSEAVHRIQYKLNMLSGSLFPLLGDKGTEVKTEMSPGVPAAKKPKLDPMSTSISAETQADDSTSLEQLSINSNVSNIYNDDLIQARTLFTFHLRPMKGLDASTQLKLNPTEYINETMQVAGFRNELNDLKLKLLNKSIGSHPRNYPKVLFLGTGSCIPNKTRNTSGILLETSDECKILVDCGEGTYGQIVRFFGPERAQEILINTQAIYVSHLHADHHIGLIGFLLGRRKALDDLQIDAPPVLLLAPKQITNWLTFYDRCFESISNEFEIIPNLDLLLGEETITGASKENILKRLNLTNVSTCHVRHCPNAFGVSFTHVDGYKITYSGDTMPCPNLVKLGQNSDLLIHEATMEDDLAGEAVVKMHSTTSQAIAIGTQMNAKYTLLTHFSQRYAKLPRFNDNFTDNVGIAFDNMQVRLDELHLVPLLYPALRLMFAEHYEELENKAAKRQLKLDRQRELSKDRANSKEKELQKV